MLQTLLVAGIIFNFPSTLFASVPTLEKNDYSSWYGYIYIGDNLSDSSTDKLRSINYKGGGPLEWGIGLGKYINNTFSVEGTFEYWGERFERLNSPIIPGTENNVIQAGGLGLSFSGIYNYHQNDFGSYLGGGVGLFVTGILVTEPGSGLLTTEGAPSDKLLLGFHLKLGLDYRIQDAHRIGIEIKRLSLKADFGQYTNGEADVGGTYILFMYRHSTK
ncbi:MAG: outer membrane beta-barrel protein [Gammaproteobacteria bacterium]|jgi:hypothetical protein